MNKIEISITEMEESIIALSFMMDNVRYRNTYCNILQNSKVDFPHPSLEALSNILVRNNNKENILNDYKVLKQVSELGILGTILDNAYSNINEAVTISFLERIQGEKERIAPIKYTDEFRNSKKAFLSYCSGKIKSIIDSSNEKYQFLMKTQQHKWIPISTDYMFTIYNKFIENCESELDILKNHLNTIKNSITDDEFETLLKTYNEKCDLVDSWDTSSAAFEAINKLKRDLNFNIEYDFNNIKNKDKQIQKSSLNL